MKLGERLKQGALKAAESEEERQPLQDYYVFGDFDESEYL